MYLSVLMSQGGIPLTPLPLKDRHWEPVVSYISKLQKKKSRLKMICTWHKSSIICHDSFPSSTVCAREGILGFSANKTQAWKHIM